MRLIHLAIALSAGIAMTGKATAEFGKYNIVRVERVPPIHIVVAPGSWGQITPDDVHWVLDTVARQVLSDVPPLEHDPISIYVIPRNDFPEVLLERNPEGAYIVRLTARDERLYQFAYQFSHELCHILSNYDHKELRDGKLPIENQWFEESLCEAVSIFTLRRLAATWDEHPPLRKWAGYGSKFHAYADQLLSQKHRQLAPNQTFGDWYKANAASLSANPYDREKDELIAGQLLPIFAKNDTYWQSIIYLNPFRESAVQPFAQYLHDWYKASPEQSRVPVKGIFLLFGLNPRLE